METKPGKYNKRQFELRPTGLHYYKKKNNQETLLVNLASYDVYTLLVQMPNAPTDFAFAIKSTDPIHFFEDKKKYIYYLYTTDVNSLFDWVMSIRQGKVNIIYIIYYLYIIIIIKTVTIPKQNSFYIFILISFKFFFFLFFFY